MKNLNYQFLIGLIILFVDCILCFVMLYLGHIRLFNYWQFVDEPFALYFLLSISIIFGIGITFIIWSYSSRRFESSI